MQETWVWVFNPWVRKVPWRRKWQHTPVFLPTKSHGQRSLAGYSPWGCKGVGHNWATKQQPHAPLDATHREGDTIVSVQRPSQPSRPHSVVSIVPRLLCAVLLCTSPLLLQSHSNDACACGCWNILSSVDITNNNHQAMELCWCKTSPHSTWGKIQLTTESCRATRWWWRFSGILQLKAACRGHGAISPLFLLCQPPATMLVATHHKSNETKITRG